MRNNRNLFTKIGFSKNPSFRESTLQSEEPDIELIESFVGTTMLEKQLHETFGEQRIRGEWFNLSTSDIETAKKFLSISQQ